MAEAIGASRHGSSRCSRAIVSASSPVLGKRDDRGQERPRLLRLPLAQVEGGQVDVRLRERGLGGDGGFELRPRLVVPPQALQELAEIVAHRALARVLRHRRAQGLHRLFVAPLIAVVETEVGPVPVVLGSGTDGALEGRFRARVSPRRVGLAEGGERIRGVRGTAHRVLPGPHGIADDPFVGDAACGQQEHDHDPQPRAAEPPEEIAQGEGDAEAAEVGAMVHDHLVERDHRRRRQEAGGQAGDGERPLRPAGAAARRPRRRSRRRAARRPRPARPAATWPAGGRDRARGRTAGARAPGRREKPRTA